ncbi:MAG: hypothetical protein WBP41_05335 [Saprospiraceae bacterium]
METSLYLAKIMGLFGALTTFTIILRYKLYLSMEDIVSKNTATMYLSGFMFLLLGILVVVSHSVWTLDWRLTITIIGWLLMAKGLMRILIPDFITAMLIKKQTEKRFIVGEITLFVISIFLIYQGFITH